MKRSKTVKTWQKASIQNLVRHRSGGYYARLFTGGKERWKSLKTPVLEVAKRRLRDEQQNAGDAPSPVKPSKSGRMTMALAIERLEQEMAGRVPLREGKKVAITESSAAYRAETIVSLRKTWLATIGADFDSTEVRKIAASDVKRWADAFRVNASGSRFNNTLGTLRRLFDIAVSAGELHRNPAARGIISRSYKEPKKTHTPTLTEFVKLVETIRGSPSRLANDCADFVEFLAYTGARKDEAAHVTWGDVDFIAERVTFRKTKNGKPRTSELIPQAKALLERIRAERGDVAPETPVLRVSQAYGSLRAAAAAIGMPRISHHDLRDFFATGCLEAGVDVPLVAAWLGHLDGGTLLLKTYSKRREEHAKRAAKRVSFAPISELANVVSMLATG